MIYEDIQIDDLPGYDAELVVTTTVDISCHGSGSPHEVAIMVHNALAQIIGQSGIVDVKFRDTTVSRTEDSAELGSFRSTEHRRSA